MAADTQVNRCNLEDEMTGDMPENETDEIKQLLKYLFAKYQSSMI